jgi:hypothetical protein
LFLALQLLVQLRTAFPFRKTDISALQPYLDTNGSTGQGYFVQSRVPYVLGLGCVPLTRIWNGTLWRMRTRIITNDYDGLQRRPCEKKGNFPIGLGSVRFWSCNSGSKLPSGYSQGCRTQIFIWITYTFGFKTKKTDTLWPESASELYRHSYKPLVGEVSANFCGYQWKFCKLVQCTGLYSLYFLPFSTQSLSIFTIQFRDHSLQRRKVQKPTLYISIPQISIHCREGVAFTILGGKIVEKCLSKWVYCDLV